MKKIGLMALLALFWGISCQHETHRHSVANPHNGHLHEHDEAEHEEHGHEEEAHHEGESEHDHQHAQNFILTAYSDAFELFAETTLPVAGKEFEVLAHFTRLSDFQPLEEGELSVRLELPGSILNKKIDHLTRPGIFEFHLKPATKGKGQLVLKLLGFPEDAEFNIPFEVFENEHDAAVAAAHIQIKNPLAIHFSKEQSWEIDFATEPVKRIPFGQTIHSTAKVELPPSYETSYSAGTSGFVQFTQNNFIEGKEVKKGEALLAIVPKNLTGDNTDIAYSEARNAFAQAQKNYERKQTLANDRIISQSALEEARLQYENARIRFENFQKNYNAGGQTIRSNSNGYLKNIAVSNGDYVEAGTPLFTLAKNDKVLLKAFIPQRYTRQIAGLYDAVIKCPGCGQTLPLRKQGGQIVSVGKSLAENSFLLPVTLNLPGHSDLLPGSLTEVWLKCKNDSPVLVIPKSALIEEQGNFSVFVQLTPELFEQRRVIPGEDDGLFVAIEKGLNGTERVVTKGAILVKLAAASGNLDPHAGHVH